MKAIICSFLLLAGARAQCTYPCWREIASSDFSYKSYSYTDPSTKSGVAFYLPVPTQVTGDNEYIPGCRTYGELLDDHYLYSDGAWVGPIPYSTPVYRPAQNLYSTDQAYSDWKGIEFRGSFKGSIGNNADTNNNALTQAVFYYENLCTEKGAEFGFYRRLQNPGDNTEQNTVYFYYALNPNCTGIAGNQGGCITPHGATPSVGTTDVGDIPAPFAIPIPYIGSDRGNWATNSEGNYDWLWQAWLSAAGAWTVQVSDPSTWANAPGTSRQTWSIPASDAPLSSAFSDIYNHGGTGYVSVTHQIAGGITPSLSDPPTIEVYEIQAAKSAQ